VTSCYSTGDETTVQDNAVIKLFKTPVKCTHSGHKAKEFYYFRWTAIMSRVLSLKRHNTVGNGTAQRRSVCQWFNIHLFQFEMKVYKLQGPPTELNKAYSVTVATFISVSLLFRQVEKRKHGLRRWICKANSPTAVRLMVPQCYH
jgi:hypothetical protein